MTKSSISAQFGEDIFKPLRESSGNSDAALNAMDWGELKTLLTHWKPVRQRKTQQSKPVTASKILGNLPEVRNAHLFANLPKDGMIREFHFALKGGKFYANIYVLNLAGATVFLRFFYGLRNILSHGDFTSTLGSSLEGFVKNVQINDETLGIKEKQDDLRMRIVKNVLEMLEGSSCVCCPSVHKYPHVADAPVNDVDVRKNVACWMADKIVVFCKYKQKSRISTLLLETMHGFLVALGEAFVGGLLDNIKVVHPKLSQPPLVQLHGGVAGGGGV